MVHAHTIKSALLALGVSAALGACGGETPPVEMVTYSMTIQKDMQGLGCLGAGCHDKNSTTKLKVDTAAGQEQTNYNNLFTNMLVIKGDGANSPLIKIPSTGMTLAQPPVSHVKTLNSAKTTVWTDWANNMAPF
jgi:hypothetical protein